MHEPYEAESVSNISLALNWSNEEGLKIQRQAIQMMLSNIQDK